jgi:hypothetical protein
VQLRFEAELTSEEYVRQQAWRRATLSSCPMHPRGGCGFARHSSYARVTPAGARVARYYCPRARVTFSLLPDCLAARLSSTLAEVERVAEEVEKADSLEHAAEKLRPDIERQGAVRWVRRRAKAIRSVLVTVVGLLPGLLAGWAATLEEFRKALGVTQVLLALREKVARHLASLPPPLGFGPRPKPRGPRSSLLQHGMGPDPPGG